MKEKLSCHLSAVLLFVATASVYSDPRYTVTVLPLIHEGRNSSAQDINNNGQIVGINFVSAVVWNNLVPTDIGNLGAQGASAVGINQIGVIVGISSIPNPQTTQQHGFVYISETMTDVGTLGGRGSFTMAVNNLNQAVGVADVSDVTGEQHAFIWQNGLMTDLGTLGGNRSIALHINDGGEIVGFAKNLAGYERAVIWRNGSITELASLGKISFASAINNQGQIAGWTNIGDDTSIRHACLWLHPSEIILVGDLGQKSTESQDINNAGTVVGNTLNANDTQGPPFLYRNGRMYNLNNLIVGASAISLSYVYAINDPGQIVANAKVNDIERAVLLTPIPPVSKEVRWQFGISGNQDYVLESFIPPDAEIGILGTFDPAIVLMTNYRYTVTIPAYADHPFEITAKSQSVFGDIVLLAQGAIVGLREDDPTIAWQDDGNGTISFTMSTSLATAFADAGKSLGYRSANATASMRGNFIVVENLDFDNDGLSNDFEVSLGTDYLSADTDGDGMPDGWEHANGFGPLQTDRNQDEDGDGYSNLQEFQRGSNPNEYVLALKQGWNSLSISRMPSDNSVTAIFGNAIAGSVWYWADGRFQTASHLEPLTGYWVFAPEPAEIEINLP